MRIFVDQLKRHVHLKNRPKRIVSLVPSLTDFLHYLKLEDEVVGITKFCVHPKMWFEQKEKIGGTKRLNINRIKELEPDLIIGNKEENTKEDILALEKFAPVWMSDVNSFEDSIEMITRYSVAMYNRTSNSAIVNEARRILFIKDGKDLDSIHLQNQLFFRAC